MVLVKATKDSESGVMPEEKLIAEMTAFHEELAKAGALVDASNLIRGHNTYLPRTHFPAATEWNLDQRR
jgi:hypothetical protein